MRTSLALAACFLTALTMSAQEVTFSSRVEAVRVDVLVTNRGKVVGNLRPEEFELRDEGVPQAVDLVSLQQLPVNVILALDVSESLNGERLEHLQNAGRALLKSLRTEDRASLLTFSHVVRMRHDLTDDIPRIQQALADVVPSGRTSLIDGTSAAIALSTSDIGRSLLIVFSDGVDTSSWLSPDLVLQSARRSNVVVYGVAMKSALEPTFLRDLAKLTGGAVFELDSPRDLSPTFVRIFDEFRQRYLLSFSPRGVSSTGWHRLDVRIKGRRATVSARAGYHAGR